jgi:hypothetical protein
LKNGGKVIKLPSDLVWSRAKSSEFRHDDARLAQQREVSADSGRGDVQRSGDLCAACRSMRDQEAHEVTSGRIHQDVRHRDHNQWMRIFRCCRRVYSTTIRSFMKRWKA